jgi:hypothetical protein
MVESGEKEVKLSLFADYMVLYLKNATFKLLDLINIFGKVARYKINVQKTSRCSMYQ